MDFYDSHYFSINKKMLVYLGLWPYQNPKAKLAIRTFFVLAMSLFLVPQFISLCKYAPIDVDRVIQSSATLLYILAIFMKLITAIITEKQLQIVYENIVQNQKMIEDKDEKNELILHSEIGRVLTIGYISYMFSALILFITMPMLPIIIDAIRPLNESRPQIFILDGEYVADKFEHYDKIYVFEGLTCTMTVVIFCTLDATYAVCVQQCVGLMAVVKLRLELATKYALTAHEEEKDDAYDRIIQSVVLHKKALNFADILESSYSMSFLIVMGLNVLILSVGSVVILVNLNRPMEFFRYSMIFIGLIIHMFYLNWPGQKLIDSSGGILQDAYNNEWYNASLKTQKLLKFIMLRCKEPCLLTAGGVYIMNIENYGLLVKTALSYITAFASLR